MKRGTAAFAPSRRPQSKTKHCHGKPTRRYVREKNAGRVDLAAFVTGLVRVCDGFVTVFCLASG
jgi:hypothetical protein